ncbi:MAG: S-methyl-5-thioribose-1-phosphate isomerase [Firmicutes bacterium]|nr:S-methyl-5-thioribose-1-phosphate isomerase [Bacillota bacterium]
MSGPEPLQTLYWKEDSLYLLDQRLLPGRIRYRQCRTSADVGAAIREMTVRGAPAIGVSAAFGMVLAAREADRAGTGTGGLKRTAAALRGSRPTAVNLDWALRRMERIIESFAGDAAGELSAALLEEARSILAEDISTNRRIGAHGAALIPDGASILTHCNAGALATAGYGTALGVIRAAAAQGKELRVYLDETRPLLQGARLTALELIQEQIPAVLVTDSCAGYLFSAGKIDLVIVGADRIAANGDTANKIGTYILAVLAGRHRIPFYVAAPCSTIDPNVEDGRGIAIEERDPEEITTFNGVRIAPAGIEAFNPAFDITPAELISALITECGLLHRPCRAGLEYLLAKGEKEDE